MPSSGYGRYALTLLTTDIDELTHVEALSGSARLRQHPKRVLIGEGFVLCRRAASTTRASKHAGHSETLAFPYINAGHHEYLAMT